MIADNIVDRNTDRESDSSADGATVDFLLIQLGSLCFHDSVAKFAQIQDHGSWDALLY
jgi:hypothetical protein